MRTFLISINLKLALTEISSTAPWSTFAFGSGDSEMGSAIRLSVVGDDGLVVKLDFIPTQKEPPKG